MELRIEGQGDFSGANVQQFILVVLCASKLAHYLTQRVVLGRAKGWEVIDDEVVDGEHICKLDVQCWFGSREEVIELVDLEVCLGVTNVDQVHPDILQTVNGFGNVAVEWLQVEILAAEQPSCSDLSEHLVDSVEIATHDVGQATVHHSPVLRLSKRRLDVRSPKPVSCNL